LVILFSNTSLEPIRAHALGSGPPDASVPPPLRCAPGDRVDHGSRACPVGFALYWRNANPDRLAFQLVAYFAMQHDARNAIDRHIPPMLRCLAGTCLWSWNGQHKTATNTLKSSYILIWLCDYLSQNTRNLQSGCVLWLVVRAACRFVLLQGHIQKSNPMVCTSDSLMAHALRATHRSPSWNGFPSAV